MPEFVHDDDDCRLLLLWRGGGGLGDPKFVEKSTTTWRGRRRRWFMSDVMREF